MRLLNEKYGTRTPADLEQRRSGKPGPKQLDRTIPNITMHWLRGSNPRRVTMIS